MILIRSPSGTSMEPNGWKLLGHRVPKVRKDLQVQQDCQVQPDQLAQQARRVQQGSMELKVLMERPGHKALQAQQVRQAQMA